MKDEAKDGISRRRFMQAGGMLAAAAAIPVTVKAATNTPPEDTAKPEEDYLQYIDPIIGNIAPLLNTNRPVVHLPNQMVRTHPRRRDYRMTGIRIPVIVVECNYTSGYLLCKAGKRYAKRCRLERAPYLRS
ncbi:twin-arginine translocation signal domain-containing protein [Mucilaginibacter sp. S1162]|uniref:Twin-arginine translocation signal domain-containing protein n=1 Tax=Mucilaginibacter humi TaxID=2732510 RepID=A0ABX1W1V7_9SPHI|nr:twin-arginine translocation signal domain-containing protein [Mucilaginibacter humi]NNU33938.1 twin-arginine translocation signal domain-containing protein [Mucilaginibacter humi]